MIFKPGLVGNKLSYVFQHTICRTCDPVYRCNMPTQAFKLRRVGNFCHLPAFLCRWLACAVKIIEMISVMSRTHSLERVQQRLWHYWFSDTSVLARFFEDDEQRSSTRRYAFHIWVLHVVHTVLIYFRRTVTELSLFL